MSETMRAIRVRESGGPEVLECVSVPRPVAGPGEVLVRVRASSVNPVDTKIRSGMLAAIATESGIMGCDMAGEVVACGPGVTAFQPGDAVYGSPGGVKGGPGALAEFLAAEASQLARKPVTLSWEAAAALPLVTITAWEGLIDRARLQPGQTVLVHGGAGGVGHIALQIAKAHGATVWVTVSSPEKAEIATRLGADGVIFYRDEPVADYVARVTGGRGFDLVFDTVGGDNVARCFDAAAVSGTVVSISTRTTADLSPLHQKGLTLHVVFMLIPIVYGFGRARHGEILTEAAALAEAGKLVPLLDSHVFSFADAAAAHTRLQSGDAVGKVVLTGFPD